MDHGGAACVFLYKKHKEGAVILCTITLFLNKKSVDIIRMMEYTYIKIKARGKGDRRRAPKGAAGPGKPPEGAERMRMSMSMITKDQVREQLRENCSLELEFDNGATKLVYYLHVEHDVETGELRILQQSECTPGDEMYTAWVWADDFFPGWDIKEKKWYDDDDDDEEPIYSIDDVYDAEYEEGGHFDRIVDDLMWQIIHDEETVGA